MIHFYGYKKCSTCTKAEKALQALNLPYVYIDITEQPPTRELLSSVQQATALPLRKFFNTSGLVYREMNLKERINSLSDSEMLDLLCSNGRLIKRPIIHSSNKSSVGFNLALFEETWS